MNKEFLDALNDLEREKNISKEDIISAIEKAVKTAYERNYGKEQNVEVLVDRETGEVMVLLSKVVVENVENDAIEVSLEEARSYDERYEVGDELQFRIDPKDFGRIAAQTAKQVVVQSIREAERNNTYNQFIGLKEELVTGRVERVNEGRVFVSIGNTECSLSRSEQVRGEELRPGQYIKLYVMDVKKNSKGTQIFVSRSHPGLVRKLFELEIPEIAEGTVEIKGIAREAGSRTKIAVFSNDENVDPVGACVGNRGSRVQSIVDELNDEKIDIIVWDENPTVLISNVLRPAAVEAVFVDEDNKTAIAVVPEQQLSLAIGREGQNVRLAARVSGWKIDIKSKAQLEESGFDFEAYTDEDAEDSEKMELADEETAALESETEETSSEETVEEVTEEIVSEDAE
jgi:transcription termination/antitermination protein NusA